MKKKKLKEAAAEEVLQPEEVSFEEAEAPAAEETEAPDAQETMEEDIALFRSLFPDVKGEEIPQEVWERVERGESLAASYALYAVQQYREEERIAKINEENGKKAPPPVEGGSTEGDYFSPDAVKSMSPAEIRKNYDKILTSMEKWN